MNLRSALLLLVAASPADAFVPLAGRSFATRTHHVGDSTSSVSMASETVQRSLLESRLKYEGKMVGVAEAPAEVVAAEPEVEEPEEEEPAAAAVVEPKVEEPTPESEPEPEPEPVEPEPAVAVASTAATTSAPADSDPGERLGEEITTAPAAIPTTAERKAAAAAQRAANREISKKLAAKRAEEGSVKQQEKMEALLSKPAELKERVQKIADRVAFSKLLPSADEVSENAAKFSTSIEKFNAREAANKLALREESNTDLVRETASGLARTAVEGFSTGIELVDSVRADEELKSVVGDALSTAGEATSALIAPDPLDDGDAVATLTRKAKVAYVALDSIGVAAFASLCGLLSYSKEGSPVAESASKAADGFVNALSAIGALGVRSYDAIADAAEGAAEAETQQAAEERRLAEERSKAEEAKHAEEAKAKASAAEEANVKEETQQAPEEEAFIDEVLAMHEEVKAAMEEEKEDIEVEEAPQEEEPKTTSTGNFQRDLLAARLTMEKK